jgi:hypothetical protein
MLVWICLRFVPDKLSVAHVSSVMLVVKPPDSGITRDMNIHFFCQKFFRFTRECT